MSSEGGLSKGLTKEDFRLIAKNGFGDLENSYVHSTALFNGAVYAGTTRNIFGLLKLFPPPDGAQMNPWPVKVPETVEELDLRAQIWRWDPSDERWSKVHTSPLIIGRQGKEVPRDLGYRGMVVFQGKSDTVPALYVSAMSSVSRGTGARILRSPDGNGFEAVSEPGLGNPNVSTFRSLIAFDGYLVAAPAGEGKTWNTTKAPKIWRTRDPRSADWELACEPGFGDENNGGIFELHANNDCLYAGTFNHVEGFQLWRTPRTYGAPWRWEKCLEKGAYRGSANEMAMSFCTFKGSVYVGSGIQNGGYDRWRFIGPAAPELIRINPDGSWDIIVGSPRETPEGMKYPLSGRGPGFDNLFSGYLWRMVEHDGWIYASTFDWSQCLRYATKVAGPYKELMDCYGPDNVAQRGGGFGLWRSRDGQEWVPVTENGMDNPYNYGARTFLSTPYGLFVGTANPFGPEIAVPDSVTGGWTYLPNERGGAEIWLGRKNDNAQNRDLDTVCAMKSESLNRKTDSRRALVEKSNQSNIHSDRPNVLITGASGLIGARVIDQLLAANKRVRVLALPGTERDVEQVSKVEVITGDLLQESSLDLAIDGIDVVYHLAALLPSNTYTDLMMVNVHGTENLLRAITRAGGVKRFVFASSVSVYGAAFDPQRWPISEESEMTPGGTENLRNYGISKVAAERLIRRYCDAQGYEYVILRPSTVYGLGGGVHNYAEEMVKRVLSDPQAGQGTGGRVSMQMVHVDDLARAIFISGTRPEARNETFNVAGKEVVSNRDMVSIIRRLANDALDEQLIPDATRTWRRYQVIYDTTKIETRLGFVPKMSLYDGMIEVVDAMQA